MSLFSYGFEAKSIVDDGRTSWTAIEQIKSWLPTVKLPILSDEMIVLFLLSCNNVIDSTKHTIQANFRIKNGAPNVFNNRDVDSPDFQTTLTAFLASSIPIRTDDNDVLHIFKIHDTNYKNFNMAQIIKMCYMLVDISVRNNPPNSIIVIGDAQGMTMMHLTRMQLGTIKTFFEFLQEAMPIKIKGIHIINTNYIILKFFSLAKAFIRSDLVKNIKFHSPQADMTQFFEEHIPARYLPKDYGGDLPSMEELHQRNIEQLRELKPYFEAEEELRKQVLQEKS